MMWIMAIRTKAHAMRQCRSKSRGAPAAADPSDGALDDPLLGQRDEAVAVAATHNLYLPRPGAGSGDGHLWPR
jgi:hypothetical protein